MSISIPHLRTTVIIAFILAATVLHSQSPFNYGQDDSIYFVSTAQRNEWGITSIMMVDERDEHDPGGMWQNWDVEVISFSDSAIADEWSPLTLDSAWQYDPDSLQDYISFLNGTYYMLEDGNLTSYGGSGYGSFEWMEIMPVDPSSSIVTTSCVGHCGGQPDRYSKNVFDSAGRIDHIIFYPIPAQDYEGKDPDSGFSPAFEQFLRSGISAATIPDTVYYRYDTLGRLVNDGTMPTEQTMSATDLFMEDEFLPLETFHQYYINNAPMERFFRDRLGFAPQLILVEINRYGVFSFALHSQTGRYYRSRDVMLQQ